MSAAKLDKLLRRKARIEERVEVLRFDLERVERPDGRAAIVKEVQQLTDDYARVARKLHNLGGHQF